MVKSRKNIYIVVKGKSPGIYKFWNGEGGASEQVKGYEGALYKGFKTVEEGIAWTLHIDGKMLELNAPHLLKALRQLSGETSSETDKILEEGKVLIHTDGSALNNPGPGGFGAVLRFKDKVREISGGFRKTTNNRMELLACIEALKALNGNREVVLYSDSKYVVDAVIKGWAKKWKRMGWMRNSTDHAENVDLWDELLRLLDKYNVEFRWVRGHDGNRDNERCDELANIAATAKELSADENYEKMRTCVNRVPLFGK